MKTSVTFTAVTQDPSYRKSVKRAGQYLLNGHALERFAKKHRRTRKAK